MDLFGIMRWRWAHKFHWSRDILEVTLVVSKFISLKLELLNKASLVVSHLARSKNFLPGCIYSERGLLPV